MSSDTWTPTEVKFNSESYEAVTYRFVNPDGRKSSVRVTDTDEEAQLLEDLVYEFSGSPKLIQNGFHRLLAKPFDTPSFKHGSRFRSPNDPGVYYCADDLRTAAAEKGFHTFRIFQESKGLKNYPAFIDHVLVIASLKCSTVDVRVPPFSRESKVFEHPFDYSATQAFARIVRASKVQSITYRSVRNNLTGKCIALLDPFGFKNKNPDSVTLDWTCFITPLGARWVNQNSPGSENLEFKFN